MGHFLPLSLLNHSNRAGDEVMIAQIQPLSLVYQIFAMTPAFWEKLYWIDGKEKKLTEGYVKSKDRKTHAAVNQSFL